MKRRIGLLLLDDFPLLSVACAVDPVRAVNALTGEKVFDWQYISVTGEDVVSSSGLIMRPHAKVGDVLDLHILFVIASTKWIHFEDPRTIAWLRRLHRTGVALGGLAGGPYILAKAGLLDGHRCTVHWEHVPAFREDFPEIDLRRTLFEIDRNRYTCAGGTAALDMMNELIARELGAETARAASEWLLQTQIREGEDRQRLTTRERFGVSNPRLLAALERIEATLDKQYSRNDLADELGMSSRHLHRLFAKHLNTTFQRHLTERRLDRAQKLLRQTGLPVLDVAVACGFTNASHFARVYRHRFGCSPSASR